MKTLVAPSLLSANFADMKPDIDMLNRSEADWFHNGCDGRSFCAKHFLWTSRD